MEDRRVFCGWLQLDIRPFKHTLMNVIKRWSWMFKEHLLNHVNQRLDTHAHNRFICQSLSMDNYKYKNG